MSEDFLKNPLSLFDVRGNTAIITGATGAFGALASKVLCGAGANVVICANNASGLKKLSAECEALGGGKETVLEANDSCFIGPNEEREIINRGNDVCTILVSMSTPPK